MTAGTEDRRAQLAAGLTSVQQRIAVAAEAAGRTPAEVTLVVVTKFFPASDVRLLAELGVTDVGENRHPEARDKAAECADLDLRWHYVGALQSNKAGAVAAYADVVESVDRPKLVGPLAGVAEQRADGLDCLAQVSLDPPGTAGRAGVPPEELHGLADRIADADGLRLRGVMAVAPLGADADAAFARLAGVAADLRRRHPAAEVVSAGMSHDLEQAIAHGATHVRVGRAVLGERPRIK